ncbi:NADH:flavin oxidoreductase/NADH oxidase [Klugiella xanthotipulae]|uniref:2,4-dienoyl-CoA reductase-like NADH-dependent reductase (Old Yellow Enzyme family) n=1 Tax=Klugiella xanthotipulae TaxID=244735 RepID=A0A543I5C7_9MICO|nr:NADH:flavin oxidoreductase/NADH oxidase [Klugiella xanthotipulae]TQM65795.1 2,4-dienoyl-CoA reductase-like NADH-dependent reductase (Old Yellow Enzyme family) [Klugiella xanthotipulae]
MASTHLFSPITLRDTMFRNRLWVSPMCQYSADKRDGVPTDWHLVHLGALARGGAGVVITEATAVVPEGRISPEDLGLWNDTQRDALARIVRVIHSHGAGAAIQLAHAGRKASTYKPWSSKRNTVPAAEGGWPTVAPSAIAFGEMAEPQALTVDGIREVVEAFRLATRRAVAAGFDAVEVHAAHGYLVHEFLSPLSNQRTDEYGGSAENRARLLLEIVRAMRAEADCLPLFVRFSATDWAEGGLTPEEVSTFARWAGAAGADLIDVSTGGLTSGAQIPLSPGYQVTFAEQLRRETRLPTSAVGLITEAEQAERILADGEADVILMGRELLRDPHFPLRAAAQLGETLSYAPRQYERAPFAEVLTKV